MALALCEKHAAELEAGFARTNTAQFKTKTAEDMNYRMRNPEITAETFDPLLASITMMTGALSEVYQVPPEALDLLTIPNPCPACSIIELGNADVINQCVDECRDEAIRLRLLPSDA